MPTTAASHPTRFSPTAILAAAFGMGLSVVIAVVVLALRQPSIGLSFVPSANGESVLVQGPELEERQGRC
ncbi:hypothetical protein ACFQY0_09060 [Haloferula chungangensis]|uniref:Uncharacterized protein n=1 Tax=Haloferula chungangensis TaxID=1048331 RepID=A0ABW2L760_9BACT